MAWLDIDSLPLWNHFYDSTFPCEHIFSVPPDDQGCNDDQQICVVGLRVREYWVHEREMEEGRQQNAAMGLIEQRSCDDAYCQATGKERGE
jgi:hypothetical protein